MGMEEGEKVDVEKAQRQAPGPAVRPASAPGR